MNKCIISLKLNYMYLYRLSFKSDLAKTDSKEIIHKFQDRYYDN